LTFRDAHINLNDTQFVCNITLKHNGQKLLSTAEMSEGIFHATPRSQPLIHTQLYFTKLAAKHRKHRKQTNSKTQQKSEQTK